jgi:hypothetical protein
VEDVADVAHDGGCRREAAGALADEDDIAGVFAAVFAVLTLISFLL